jgi:two-component system response regulator YesN
MLITISTNNFFVVCWFIALYPTTLPFLQSLSNKQLSVGKAATFCNLSKSHFAHMFSKVFGMPFAQYERLYRLRCALTELNTKKNGLKEVAENWGFYDKSHFSKICKKYLKNSSNKQ